MRRPEEHEAPVWPIGFLQNLARYVYSSGNWFEPGDHVDANGPIYFDRQDSLIRAFAFAVDPELGVVDSPNGRFQFLQVVGLTLDEYDAARSWRTQGLLEAVTPHMPLYITDLDRTSLLAHDDVDEAIRTGIEREGSGLGMLCVETVSWESRNDSLHLRFSASACPAIADALVNRLPHRKSLTIAGSGRSITFSPDDSAGVSLDEGVLTLDIHPTELSVLVSALHNNTSPAPLPVRPHLVIAFDHET
ncbi:suppressor of fused domain protein [Nocardia sp. NPDC058658]|uniref:suppressor of fused domain protein n=1 Tax=Nocardia sp. NPDC058658 TaxID=3346580 RepID=UPI00365C32F0